MQSVESKKGRIAHLVWTVQRLLLESSFEEGDVACDCRGIDDTAMYTLSKRVLRGARAEKHLVGIRMSCLLTVTKNIGQEEVEAFNRMAEMFREVDSGSKSEIDVI